MDFCFYERRRSARAEETAAQPPLIGVRFAPRYQNNNLSRCEAPLAVGHPRETEKPPGTRSGRRLKLENAPSPVERLFPPSGGVSRGSVRVGGETFLLPSYGFSFGYKRKGVSFAPPTKTRKKSMYGARTAVKPAEGGLPSSVTVQCQGTAPRHLPQGEGYGGS